MARHFCAQRRMSKDLHLDLGDLVGMDEDEGVGVAGESLRVGEVLGLYRSAAFVRM